MNQWKVPDVFQIFDFKYYNFIKTFFVNVKV